jgi:hypothetical protein
MNYRGYIKNGFDSAPILGWLVYFLIDSLLNQELACGMRNLFGLLFGPISMKQTTSASLLIFPTQN